MIRVNVCEDGRLLGWFDAAKAERWTDADYSGNGSGGTGRGQAINRTAGGKWILENWTIWQGESSTYAYITPGEAHDWLLRNHEDGAAAKYFGEIAGEEDRRPGRPEVGGAVHVRLGELLGRVDAFAAEHGDITRAGAIRELLLAGLSRHGCRGGISWGVWTG